MFITFARLTCLNKWRIVNIYRGTGVWAPEVEAAVRNRRRKGICPSINEM